jgi:hypothetical protein
MDQASTALIAEARTEPEAENHNVALSCRFRRSSFDVLVEVESMALAGKG